jgi:tripartite-type tricarboxylate transporter receptor subunit TctC
MRLCTAALGALLIVDASSAADWPTKPIRLVVPSAAGGAADLMGRTFATALAGPLGQQFVIDNRPGAGGSIATESVIRAQPDGYTLMVSGLPYHVLGPAMNANIAYDPIRDFTHIAYFGGSPLVLVAHPALGIATFAQLTAHATGEKTGVDYVSPGFGTVAHMVVEYLVLRAKLKLRHVPYKGGSAAMIDLVAGHVKVGCLTWSTAREHIRAGQLVPLAISTAERLPEFASMPTFAELGYADIVVTAWFSLSGPAGMPAPIVQRLNILVNEAMGQSDVRRNLEREAALARPMAPAEFVAFMRSELDKWTPLARMLEGK